MRFEILNKLFSFGCWSLFIFNVMVPSQAAEKMPVLKELPLMSKTKVPIIFVGKITEVVWDYPDGSMPKPSSPRDSRRLMAAVKVINTIKSPDSKPFSGQFYVPLGSVFDIPAGLTTSWDKTTSFFVDKRFIFFGVDTTPLGDGNLLLNSGRPIKAELADKEAEVLRLLRQEQ